MRNDRMPFDRAEMEQYLSAHYLEVTPQRLDMLERYYTFLYEENQKVNLSGPSVFSGDEFLYHVVTSTQPVWRCQTRSAEAERENNDTARYLKEERLPEGWIGQAGLKVIDIGSGQGMPGLIVKIFAPQWDMTLLEANGKKCRFLEEAIDVVGFSGEEKQTIRVVNARAEELAREAGYRAAFDLALSRAVASLTVVAEYALPFLKIGGRMLYWGEGSGQDGLLSVEEDAALALLGGKGGAGRSKMHYRFHETWTCMVYCVKIAETPDKYPRRTGIPKKRPL